MTKIVNISDRLKKAQESQAKDKPEKVHPFNKQELEIVLQFLNYVRTLSASDDAFIEIHNSMLTIRVEHNIELDSTNMLGSGLLLEDSINTFATFANVLDDNSVENLSESLDALLITRDII
jgi:hypothetical protein